MNNEKQNKGSQQGAGMGVTKLTDVLLRHKRLFAKVLGIAFVLSCIYAFSIPKYYECKVMLAPELSSARSTTSLSSLARSFGMRLGNTTMNSSEALYPTLYPDLMNSVDFKTSLFLIPVTIEGDEEKGLPDRTMSYYDYLMNEQKLPWWGAARKAFSEWLVSLFKDEEPENTGIDPFRLTNEQTTIAKLIDKKVVCDVDQKTMVISIEVTDQNALICATMADSVKMRLQDFITDYRTIRNDDIEYKEKTIF